METMQELKATVREELDASRQCEEALRTQLTSIHATLSATQSRFDELESTLTAERSTFEEQRAAAERRAAELLESIETLTVEKHLALVEAETACESNAATIRDMEQQHAALEKQLRETKEEAARTSDELETRLAESNQRLEDATEAWKIEREQLISTHGEAVQAAAEAHAQALLKVESDYVKRTEELQHEPASSHAAQLKTFESESANEVETSKNQLSEAMGTRIDDEAKKHARVIDELESRIQQLQQQYNQTEKSWGAERDDLATRVATLEKQLVDARSDAARTQNEVEAQRAAHERSVKESREARSVEREELGAKHEQHIHALNGAHQQSLDHVRAESIIKLDELHHEVESTHAALLETSKNEAEVEIATIHQEMETALQQTKEERNTRQQDAAEHVRAMAEVQQRHLETESSWRREREQLVSAHEDSMRTASASHH